MKPPLSRHDIQRWLLVWSAALVTPGGLTAQEANYALGRPAISSAQVVPGNPLGNLTDGNRTTYTLPSSGSTGFYYQIDLGQVRELDRIVLWQRRDCCPERLRRYRVSLFGETGGTVGALNWSGDLRMNGTFAPVATGDTITAAMGTGTAFAGRYLRIESRSGEASNPQIAEVEAWPSPLPVIRRFDTTAGNLTAIGNPQRPTSATLSWQVDNFGALEITPTPGIISGVTGSVTVSPTVTTTYTLTATNASGPRSVSMVIGVDEPEQAPFISEFLAAPNASYLDEDGDGEDWVEISNPNNIALNLEGFSLTDDPAQPAMWPFPAVTLPAQGRLVVFASGKDRRTPGLPLHTNFSLKAGGEYLAMVGRDGVSVLSQFPANYPDTLVFSKQAQGKSYGLDAAGLARFFNPPTPGNINGPGFTGVVEDTSFSVKRGFFTTPQNVEITSLTPGAVIRYTTNSTVPTATTGLVYTGPIPVITTTVLRAAAFKDDFAPTNTDTHTYIFPEKVKTSSVMGTSITNNATYGPQVLAALTDLPSFSMVTTLTIPNGVDVPTSLEMLEPGGAPGSGFQENCGVERFGGDYTDFPKKSFRFHFRQSYGNGRLQYPLFTQHGRGMTAVDTFNALEFRSGSHDMAERGFYLSNPFTDAVLLDMGSLNPHGRWVHLYNNGVYWGVYHLRERWDADMQSDYLGGTPEDYESINGNLNVGGWAEPGDPYDGDGSSWARIKSLRANYASVRAYVDVPQYVDYMLMFMFGDSEGEFRCSGPKGKGSGFKFYLNDADGWLRSSAGNNTSRGAPGRQNGDGPGSIFSTLFKENNPDYRMLLADRIQKYFFNGGALTQVSNTARLNELAKALERPFIAESARWNNRTPASWLSAKNQIATSWFNSRTNTVLAQFRTAGFFPALAAPVFSQRGGAVAAGTRINLTSAADAFIYYTTDGSDPRLPGGALSPTAQLVPNGVAINRNTLIRARTRNSAGTAWSALDEAFFLVDSPVVSSGDVVISELHFNPAGIAQEEFVELQNISSHAVNLRGCRFAEGISYEFPENRDVFLAPGQRMVLVADFPGFHAKYGLDIPVAGRFFGNLNNGGEKLTMVKSDGSGVLVLTYDDAAPWPAGGDGGGNTLVRREGADRVSASAAAGWRISAQAGGSPGGKDTVPFSGNPDADADSDGLSAWAEYAFGTSDSDPAAGNTLQATALSPGRLKLTFQRALNAEAVSYLIETSENLADWLPPAAAPVLLSQAQNVPGTILETWEIALPFPAMAFVRMRLTKL